MNPKRITWDGRIPTWRDGLALALVLASNSDRLWRPANGRAVCDRQHAAISLNPRFYLSTASLCRPR